MTTNFVRSFTFSAALLLLGAASAQAGSITPVSVVYTGAGSSPNALIDGSGLSGGDPYTGVTHTGFNNSFAGPTHTNDQAIDIGVLARPLDFNLGGLYSLTGIDLWNYSHEGFQFYTARDAKTINISLSTDGSAYTFATTVTLTSVGTAPEPKQQFGLFGDARYVRLQITSPYGDPNSNGAEVGLGEVRFEGSSAAPEPSTYAMILSGIIGLGVSRYRRRTNRI